MSADPFADLAPAEQLPAKGERVLVAMSGGVDSSVVAALLHERGCEVVGVTLKLWEDPDPCGPEGGCCTPEDILDARRICDALDVPHMLLDYRQQFEEAIIGPFVEAYQQGRTPNPCIGCNNLLKFDLLMGRMDALDARWLATGHYARLLLDQGRTRLLRGRDRGKDQSYFLAGTSDAAARRISFPLGSLNKADVRRHAARLGLRTAGKADSQDVCFIPGGDTAAFVARSGGRGRPGEIVDEEGRVLGRHDGVHGYTVGQRKGLGVAAKAPLYVRKIDAARRRLVVTSEERLDVTRVQASGFCWRRAPDPDEDLRAQVRYRGRSVAVDRWTVDAGAMQLQLRSPLRAVAPGQTLVLYGGEAGVEVLGAGTLVQGVESLDVTASQRATRMTPRAGPW